MPRPPKILPPNRLTIIMVANGGLKGLTDHLPAFFKGAWPAILVLAAGSLLFILNMPKDKSGSVATQALLESIPIMMVGMVLMASFGVSWRRYLILGTRPSSFYFGRGFWSFTWRTFIAMLGYMLIGFGIFAALLAICASVDLMGIDFHAWDKIDINDGRQMFFLIAPIILLLFLSLIPAWWWLARHMPYFAAKAVEDDSVTWRSVFPLMRGNVWPYLIGSIMAVIPVYVVQISAQMATTIIFKNAPIASGIAWAAIWQISTLGMIAISASVGATLYKRVIKNDKLET